MPCMSNLESPLVRPQTPFPQQCPLLHTNPTKIPQRTPSAQTFSCLSVHCSVCAGCERSQGVGVLDWLPLAIPPTHPSSQLDCDITSCSFIWPARKLWESWSHLGHVWFGPTWQEWLLVQFQSVAYTALQLSAKLWEFYVLPFWSYWATWTCWKIIPTNIYFLMKI